MEGKEFVSLNKVFNAYDLNQSKVNPNVGIGLYYSDRVDIQEREMRFGDIVHVVFDKFGEGKNEVWTIDYEAPSFVVYNQVNSNREIEDYDDPEEKLKYCFTTHGDNQLLISYYGNKFDDPCLISKLEHQKTLSSIQG